MTSLRNWIGFLERQSLVDFLAAVATSLTPSIEARLNPLKEGAGH